MEHMAAGPSCEMKHPAVDMFVTIVPLQVGLLSYLNLAPPISDTIASIQPSASIPTCFSLYPSHRRGCTCWVQKICNTVFYLVSLQHRHRSKSSRRRAFQNWFWVSTGSSDRLCKLYNRYERGSKNI